MSLKDKITETDMTDIRLALPLAIKEWRERKARFEKSGVTGWAEVCEYKASNLENILQRLSE